MVKKTSRRKPLQYGPVLVCEGAMKGRIGYYDDDAYNEERERDDAIVYFGRMIYARTYTVIPFEHLAQITTQALIRRHEALTQAVTPYAQAPLKGNKRADALEELQLIEGLLAERMLTARGKKARKKTRVFISHSSLDKEFAIWISVDLKNSGYDVWLDSWNIKVGESIPSAVGVGLDVCDFVAVVLSSHAVNSRWVENEWHAKHWDEVQQGRVRVLPLLIEDCTVPTLLKTKKYADFRHDHQHGLDELLDSLAHHAAKKSRP
ncbi:MAG: transrane sensor protein [Gemmatimonadetes bacterium]|nr:transrane sensor protein [Gemmatimonadota bacterium]